MTLTVLAEGGPLGVISNPFIYLCSTTGDSSVMRLAGAQLKQLETSPPALGWGGWGGGWGEAGLGVLLRAHWSQI